MTMRARARLQHRNTQLQTLLIAGSSLQIMAARELLRQSMVELHELGYWRDNPDQLNVQMRLYRAAAKMMFSPVSMSAPDKRDQCIL
jgi:hypothetical protein